MLTEKYFLYEQAANGKLRIHMKNLTLEEADKQISNLGFGTNAPKLVRRPMTEYERIKKDGLVEEDCD